MTKEPVGIKLGKVKNWTPNRIGIKPTKTMMMPKVKIGLVMPVAFLAERMIKRSMMTPVKKAVSNATNAATQIETP